MEFERVETNEMTGNMTDLNVFWHRFDDTIVLSVKGVRGHLELRYKC